MQYPYFGPKKTLKWMEQNHPIAFVHYKTALEDFSVDSLKNWITYIKNAIDENITTSIAEPFILFCFIFYHPLMLHIFV